MPDPTDNIRRARTQREHREEPLPLGSDSDGIEASKNAVRRSDIPDSIKPLAELYAEPS